MAARPLPVRDWKKGDPHPWRAGYFVHRFRHRWDRDGGRVVYPVFESKESVKHIRLCHKRYSEKNREEICRRARARRRTRLGHILCLLRAAKTRAKKAGVSFALKPEHIVIPKRCPVLGIKLKRTGVGRLRAGSVTIDRVIPELGYIPANVRVISHLANTVKFCSSGQQLLMVAKWAISEELVVSKAVPLGKRIAKKLGLI